MSRWTLDRSSDGKTMKGMRRFNSIIEELELLKIPISNGKFTWSKMGNDRTHSLLDRFFISQEWNNLFVNSTSDHFSIVLDVGDFIWGSTPLRFFSSWLEDKDCIRLIESKISEDISYD